MGYQPTRLTVWYVVEKKRWLDQKLMHFLAWDGIWDQPPNTMNFEALFFGGETFIVPTKNQSFLVMEAKHQLIPELDFLPHKKGWRWIPDHLLEVGHLENTLRGKKKHRTTILSTCFLSAIWVYCVCVWVCFRMNHLNPSVNPELLIHVTYPLVN